MNWAMQCLHMCRPGVDRIPELCKNNGPFSKTMDDKFALCPDSLPPHPIPPRRSCGFD